MDGVTTGAAFPCAKEKKIAPTPSAIARTT